MDSMATVIPILCPFVAFGRSVVSSKFAFAAPWRRGAKYMLAKKLLLNMMGRIMVGSEAVKSGHQEKPSVMRVGSNQIELA